METTAATTINDTPKVSMVEVMQHVEGLGLGSMMHHRVVRILGHFETVDEFAKASSLKWEAMYRLDHPKSKYGLGKAACRVLTGIVTYINNLRFERRLEERGRKAEEARINSPKVQAKIAEAKEAVENPVFTRKQIKALSDMMEFCDLETVNLRTIAEFFKAFGVKNPFVEGQEPGRPNAQ